MRPLDALYVALAGAAVGTIVGQGLAAYRFERNPNVNTTRIIFAWTLVGLSEAGSTCSSCDATG